MCVCELLIWKATRYYNLLNKCRAVKSTISPSTCRSLKQDLTAVPFTVCTPYTRCTYAVFSGVSFSPLCPGQDHKTAPAAARWCSSRSRCCPQRPASGRASRTRSAHSGPGCLAWWGRWTCSQWSQCSLGSYPEKHSGGRLAQKQVTCACYSFLSTICDKMTDSPSLSPPSVLSWSMWKTNPAIKEW